MRKIKKILLAAVIAVVALFAIGQVYVSAYADTTESLTLTSSDKGSGIYTNPETSYQVFIEDDADLLTSDEENSLAARMQQLTDFGGAAFVSSSDTDGTSTKEYARQKCYKFFGSDSGSVFLIDMQNRQIYIFSNGTIFNTVTSEKATIITDNIYRYARNGDYYKCAASAFEQELTLLGGGRIARPMKYISNALIAIVAGLLINYFIVRGARNSAAKANAAMLGAVKTRFDINNINPELVNTTKTPISTGVHVSGGGFSGGGGGFSGGGGGGFSGGGGGGHSF